MKEVATECDVPMGHLTRSHQRGLTQAHNSTLTLALLKSFPKDLLKTETAAHWVTFVGESGVPESQFLHTMC